MSSFVMKSLIGNEFDKVFKEFNGSDKEDQNEDNTMSPVELADEQNRQAAEARERKARHAELEKEREKLRQNIRDKYHIKKKDDPPTATKNHQQGKIDDLTTRTHNINEKLEKINGPEPQGFQPVKAMTDAFNGLKRTFGWK